MSNPRKYVPISYKLDPSEMELTEKVVFINRVAKVVKGGRRFHFTAVVVVGDGQGHVGAAMGKAAEVPEAIRKASTAARKNLIRVPMQGSTLPHEMLVEFGAARVEEFIEGREYNVLIVDNPNDLSDPFVYPPTMLL